MDVPRLRHRPRHGAGAWSLTALAGVIVLTACASSSPTDPATVSPAAAPTVVSADQVDPALLQPLVGLGPCDVDPNTISPTPVAGLVLPPDAQVTSQTTDGPLTTVRGYVAATPVQTQVEYLRQTELEVLQAEHEVHESETLLRGGEHRLFVKVQAVCELGSVFIAIVAPEAAGAPVPVPSGAGGA